MIRREEIFIMKNLKVSEFVKNFLTKNPALLIIDLNH